MGAAKYFNTIIVPLGYAESQSTSAFVFTCERNFKTTDDAEKSLAFYLLCLLTRRCENSLEDKSKECCGLSTGKFCSECGFLLRPEFKITSDQYINFLYALHSSTIDSYGDERDVVADPDLWNPFCNAEIKGPIHIMGNSESDGWGYAEKKLAKLAGLIND